MPTERRGMVHIQLPSDVMEELFDASTRRKTSVAAEAMLWLRLAAQTYKTKRLEAGEELIRLRETVVIRPAETSVRNRWDN